MTRLWALLALQLSFGLGCFITNCPQGGKRSSPPLASDGLQLHGDTSPFLPLDTPPAGQTEQLRTQPAQQPAADKRLLMALRPGYQQGGRAQTQGLRGTCFIEGVCSYPDCCHFEECADSTECRVLRKGYRILVKYIFSKLESVGSRGLEEGAIA